MVVIQPNIYHFELLVNMCLIANVDSCRKNSESYFWLLPLQEIFSVCYWQQCKVPCIKNGACSAVNNLKLAHVIIFILIGITVESYIYLLTTSNCESTTFSGNTG